MADSWQTFPIEFRGGLLTNQSPLQQGVNSPGSASILQNFEPSVEGGYRKIEGYSKFDTNQVAGSGNIRGITRFGGAVIIARGTHLYRSSGSGWTQLTDNGSFSSTGVNISGSGRVRFAEYNFTGTSKLFIVDGNAKPYIFTGTALTQQTSLASDFTGADFVTVHLDRLFVAIENKIICTATASATSDNFSGSTSFTFDETINDFISFREQLIIFTENSIQKLTGNTTDTFAVLPISNDLGAVAADTVQEVGADIMFLAADGLRLLGATERIGDFSLAVVSKNIQSEFASFIANSTSFSSITIRDKSQYRIFGYNAGFSDAGALGILGTQFALQGGEGMAWGETRGINALVAHSSLEDGTEFIHFANDNGYVYRLESGNSFDGSNITATFQSPFFPITDPRMRKTFYKLILYTDPVGSLDTTVDLKLDFEKDSNFQPSSISFSSAAENAFFYDNPSAVFNTATYGSGSTQSQFESQLVGSGFTAALKVISEDTNPPFSLDSATIEYAINERR
jgi:hypothetical protein